MNINNFKLIEDLLDFKSDKDFYYVELLQDNFKKVFYIQSLEDWNNLIDIANNSKYETIVYMNLNKCNYQDCCLDAICKFTEILKSNNFVDAYDVWESTCKYNSDCMYYGVPIHNDKDVEDIINIIKTLNPDGLIKQCKEEHTTFLITSTFNVRKFNQKCLIQNIDFPFMVRPSNILLYQNDILCKSE